MTTRLALITFTALLLAILRPAEAQQGAAADSLYILEALQSTLETRRSGTRTAWKNRSTAHVGVIIPGARFTTVAGRTCRKYEQTQVIGRQVTTLEGVACREDDGWWSIREEKQFSRRSTARTSEKLTDVTPSKRTQETSFRSC